jgi:hypothetical protein
LTLEEARGDGVEVWPDNALSVNVFTAVSTQWRTGQSGITGLDYNVFPFVMETCGVLPEQKIEVFDNIRIMEDEVLLMMNEKK